MKTRLATLIGNLLGHYDTALYGLVGPFIAPLFFKTQDPLTALILTYAITPMSILTRPLGSLFFGWLSDVKGRKDALFYSLMGMAIVTALMGALPTHAQIGSLAPCLLACGRMLQGFFSAGESASASIAVMEHTPADRRNWISSWYDVSSVSGMLLASALASCFCSCGWMEQGWRILFFGGSLTAFFGLIIRSRMQIIDNAPQKRMPIMKAILENRSALISIALASGFSYITYAMAFTLINVYAPLVSRVTQAEMMAIHAPLLIVDMALLPCFGWLAHRFGRDRIMIIGALCSASLSLPLFACLKGAGIIGVTLIRFAIVLFGVAFAAPYHAWKLEQIPKAYRCTLLAMGCTLGAKLIGAPVSAICLWVYQITGIVWAPGIYLVVFGLLAAGTVQAKYIPKSTKH